mgnify:CR=1 FL=1
MNKVRHTIYRDYGVPKLKERERAIDLRREGLSYSEILKQVPVAKSTLSVWLGDVGLTTKQKQRLTEKRLSAARRGGLVRHTQRIESTNRIHTKAVAEVRRISRRDLWLLGIALYWAEGSKQKEHNPSSGIIFSNSDHRMVMVFRRWLISLGVSESDIYYSIYLHSTHAHRASEIKQFWERALGLAPSSIEKVYFKNSTPSTNRKNVKNEYYGLVRLRVRRSTNLNRMIAGWVEGSVKELPRQ